MSSLYNWVTSLFTGWFTSPARNAPTSDIPTIKKMIESKTIFHITEGQVQSRLKALKSVSLDKVIECQLEKQSPFEVLIQQRRNNLKKTEINPFTLMIKAGMYALRHVPEDLLVRPKYEDESKDKEMKDMSNTKEEVFQVNT